jgi:segregation and condensation protein B
MERSAKLSNAALETLALVAYRQPITRVEIESIRGVDSTGVVSTLIARELIEPRGRRATPGNPVEYGTTPQFLQFFGLASLADLPPLSD